MAKEVVCQICNRRVKLGGLSGHLRFKHPKEYKERGDLDSFIKLLLIKEYKEGKIPTDKMLTYLMMLRVLKG